VNKLILGASALLVLAACGQEQPATQQVADEAPALKSGIGVEGMDTSVRPGDDFFAYVNGKWVAETDMPSDKSRYGTFDILRDESQENVTAII
jgi:putative endopeptidase